MLNPILLLGMVFVAILVMAFLVRRVSSQGGRAASVERRVWKCGNCGFINDDRYKWCRRCGYVDMERYIPKRIDDYQILRLIYIGGLTEIYLGHQADHPPTWENLVVVKRAKELYRDEMRVQMRNEAEMLSALDCLNVPRFVGWDEVGEEYIVMEYLEGRNLEEFGRLDRTDMIDITLELLDTLECVQSHNIIHRDIKPRNLLLGNKVALIDFSIAGRVGERGGKRCIPAGTLHYNAPEAEGGVCIIENDVYSLGATMYYMVTGKDPPVRGRCRWPDDGADEDLKSLIDDCMRINPAERPVIGRVRSAIRAMERRPRVFVQGRSHPITKDLVTVGSSENCDIRVYDRWGYVDGVHAMVSKEGEALYIMDNGSKIGTFVKRGEGFVRIDEPIRLENGDMFALGYSESRGPYVCLRFRSWATDR